MVLKIHVRITRLVDFVDSKYRISHLYFKNDSSMSSNHLSFIRSWSNQILYWEASKICILYSFTFLSLYYLLQLQNQENLIIKSKILRRQMQTHNKKQFSEWQKPHKSLDNEANKTKNVHQFQINLIKLTNID